MFGRVMGVSILKRIMLSNISWILNSTIIHDVRPIGLIL